MQFQQRSVTEDLLSNPIWHALAADHSRFAICTSGAYRYRPDVAPFAGLANLSRQSLSQLSELLEPGEYIYVLGDRQMPNHESLTVEAEVPALQMVRMRSVSLTEEAEATDAVPITLGAQDVRDMVALTKIAIPGFFRPRTYEMGEQFGIRVNGELVAMAGERIALPDHREISAVCIHPAHTGKGYAAQLVRRLLQLHEELNVTSFLHVDASNEEAIRLYERLGFVVRRSVVFRRLLCHARYRVNRQSA